MKIVFAILTYPIVLCVLLIVATAAALFEFCKVVGGGTQDWVRFARKKR